MERTAVETPAITMEAPYEPFAPFALPAPYSPCFVDGPLEYDHGAAVAFKAAPHAPRYGCLTPDSLSDDADLMFANKFDDVDGYDGYSNSLSQVFIHCARYAVFYGVPLLCDATHLSNLSPS